MELETLSLSQNHSFKNRAIENVTKEFQILLDASSNENSHENGKPKFVDVIPTIVISFVSLVINSQVFCIVMDKTRKQRTVSILIAHLTALTISNNLYAGLYNLDKSEVIILRAPVLCGVVSFVRNTLFVVFPLNVLLIIYEQVRTFQTEATENLLVYRAILFIWVTAAGCTIPSFFSYGFEPDTSLKGFGICKKVVSIEVQVIYELARFLLFHLIVSGYISYQLYTIRSKLKYLHFFKPIPDERIRWKIQRVRFVYIYAVLFIVVWLPVGFFFYLLKLLTPGIFGDTSISVNWFLSVTTFVFYSYCILNPLIYMCLIENMRVRQVLSFNLIKLLFTKIFRQKSSEENHEEDVFEN